MIHEIDPEVNYWPMYSIEYVPRDATAPVAWAQFHLTHRLWLARLYAVENWLRHSKNNKTRVRVL